MKSNFEDVKAFHVKFGLPHPNIPQFVSPDVASFRLGFLQEELQEFRDAYLKGNLADAADALIDLVYVAMGTAVMMGLPWELLWDEVQRVNMTKVRAEHAQDERSKRGHAFDVVKPEGWTPPNIEYLLMAYTRQQETAAILQGQLFDPVSSPTVFEDRQRMKEDIAGKLLDPDHGDMTP